jgi:transcriptional regulator with XRE-family HTH domain
VPVKRTRLAARRKVVGFSQDKLAERLQVDHSTVVRWENGESFPQPWKRAELAKALQISAEQLDELLTEPGPAAPGVDAMARLPKSENGQHYSAINQPLPNSSKNSHNEPGISQNSRNKEIRVTVSFEEEQEEMERRRLLQSLVALGVQISPLSQALDAVRSAFGGTVGHDDRSHLDDWEETAVEYGYAYMSTSPLRLIPDLAADLVSVRSIVRGIPRDTSEYRSWCRVSGVFAGLIAKSLSNLGQSRDSSHWWSMAQHVADESGDLSLSLWIRGQRIIHGLYENRPTPILLRQVEGAKKFSRDHQCAGLASISVGHAQLSVISGDYGSAEQELQRASKILDRLPPGITDDGGSIMSWGEAQLRYSEAWVYSHMGHKVKTERAIGRALQLYPDTDTRSPVQVKLMKAFAHVQSGEINEGIRYAQTVYEPLDSEQRTTMINVLARRVLSSIPHDERNNADIAEYRALVAHSATKAIES